MTHTTPRALFVSTVILCVLAVVSVRPAYADAPHVAFTRDTDTCAICHRAHSAASTITVSPLDGSAERNALIVGGFLGSEGDTALCFSCHDGLGASNDILTDFRRDSVHALAPATSAYGNSPKDCSSCHDSHGSARSTDGSPYPALLQSRNEAGGTFRSGDAFCTACHLVRPGNSFPGAAVWEQTAHSKALARSDGTQVTCSICHAPHGSDNTALVTMELAPPSVASTIAVPANDRWLCFGCHPASEATYAGGATYQGSTHGLSTQTVAVSTEWAARLPVGSPDRDRRVGECQACHVAMGADDGSGEPVAKLAKADGDALCFSCHGQGSVVATDIASVYAPAGAPVLEVFGAFGGATDLRHYGLAQAYTRETSSSATLLGPRPVLEGNVGPTTAGDIDGDGSAEVLVSRSGTAGLSVIRRSPLSGLTARPGPVILLAEPTFLAVGDVLSDVAGLNEVVAADGSMVRVYRWDGATLAPVAAAPATYTITGLATGDVVGTSADDIVVTTTGAANADNRIVVATGGTGLLELSGSYVVGGHTPQGPSIGDLDGVGKAEIAVAMGGDTTDVLQVYDGVGTQIAVAGTATGNQRAQRALIGDALWGVQAAGRSPAEVAVTFADPADGARVDIFPQTAAGGFSTAVSVDLTQFSNPAEMAAGDLDGDGRRELVIARAGSFPNRVPAGLEVLKTDAAGTGIATTTFYPASGVESADSVPGRAWVAAVELGTLGLSRHATDGTPDTHVSTETAGFARHVECVDCHNVHEATSTVAAAPAAFGAIEGAWGVSVDNSPVGVITYTEKQGVSYEYELCMKCHGSWSSSGDTRDIAQEVDTRKASVHAVEAPSTSSEVLPDSFVAASTPWGNNSVLYCIDCHGNANGAEAPGPHASTQAPLLRAPVLGVSPSEATGLCYGCHRYDVYYSGLADDGASGSRFWRSTAEEHLHLLHGSGNGIGCAACHASHGSSEPHLLRDDVGYTHQSAGGGECTNDCHAGDTHLYEGR